jgi:hypothetical protein
MSWFNNCLKNYCPRIIPYLEGLKGIISARDMYGEFVSNIVMWKSFCVLDIININKEINPVTNILFVSDLNNDFKSVYKVKALHPQLKIKTYKFREEPMICQLIKQQRDFTRFLDFIIRDNKIKNYRF